MRARGAMVVVLAVVVAVAVVSVRGDDPFGAGDYTCYYTPGPTPSFRIAPGTDAAGAAWATYSPAITDRASDTGLGATRDPTTDANQGWNVISVRTNRVFPDPIQVEAAGYLEGAVTQSTIRDSFINFWSQTFNNTPPANLILFTQQNLDWTFAQVANIDFTKPQSDFNWQYWAQVALVTRQMTGMLNGYNDHRDSAASPLTLIQLHLLNMDGDLDDLIPAMQRRALILTNHTLPDVDLSPTRMQEADENSHCSSSVVVSPDQKTLFSGHEMWGNYRQLIESYKHYDFDLSLESTAATGVSFSAYPAYISSEDDFYITTQQLTVMETTNSIFNQTLYDLLVPNTLMSWIRVVVANRMAHNGSEWTDIFAHYNSGTYNNQWMIVDYKRWQAQTPVKDHLLWITEQIPGYLHAGDVSGVIRTHGYWPSFNIPYYPDIYQMTGTLAAYEKYGDMWSWSLAPRANIFRRDAKNINTITDFQRLMRSNDYTRDPLALGCPCFQLAARGDLAPPEPRPDWGYTCRRGVHGALNAKVTQSQWIVPRTASIILGPTSQSLAPFRWTAEFPISHVGQPDLFNYTWFTAAHTTKPIILF